MVSASASLVPLSLDRDVPAIAPHLRCRIAVVAKAHHVPATESGVLNKQCESGSVIGSGGALV